MLLCQKSLEHEFQHVGEDTVVKYMCILKNECKPWKSKSIYLSEKKNMMFMAPKQDEWQNTEFI